MRFIPVMPNLNFQHHYSHDRSEIILISRFPAQETLCCNYTL